MFDSLPGRLFVGSVLFLVVFIGYTPQLVLFLPVYDWQTSLLYLLPLNFLLVMVFYNYYLVVTTDPGSVPKHWEPPSSIVLMSREPPSEGITGPRFCKSCDVYKPPRSHHCKYCKRCVLKMDHHCPWINNCVGYYNYGHFLRFILYTNMACLYLIILFIGRVRATMSAIRQFQFDAEPDTTQVVIMAVNFALAFCVLCSVGILTVYQLYCLTRNQSTIEAWERSKVERLVARGKIPYIKFPFDIGVYENICQVLGPNPFLWLWPQKMQGDGLTFPIAPGTDRHLSYFWPPRDPDDLRPSIFSSKYKRQQEAQRLLRQDHDVLIEEDCYDSGSFMTDSDEEYRHDDDDDDNIPLVNYTPSKKD